MYNLSFTTSLFLLTLFTSTCLSDTCPKKLLFSYDGFWYSNQHPGWKSLKQHRQYLDINASHFKSAHVYPAQNRITCRYANRHHEATLTSKPHTRLNIDSGLVTSNNAKLWKWNEREGLFRCTASVTVLLQHCRFSIEEK